jgi:methylated-DNA-[protein]-cysteine S-methyltransferase
MDMENHSPHRYTSFKTDLGWVGMLVSPTGIVRLTLPQATEKAALDKLKLGPEAIRMSFERFDEAVTRIREYFRGKPVDFEDKLDLSSGTKFQKKVWASCRSIPYGQTRSYGWIARQIGKPGASRAVGNALGKNPIPIIIPCHRVLAADGGIGGFSGGLSAKLRLLKLEGVKFKDSPQR